jgi:hypothetical protein
MTYRDLLKCLSEMPTDRLDDNVTLWDVERDEYIPITEFDYIVISSVLDDGHPILVC